MVGRVGLSVALEGIDGCGKSTQLGRLTSWLARRHPALEVLVLREPGGTRLGESVRELLLAEGDMDPMAEMLLYMVARAELYARVVQPALARGALVLLDRSYYSTAAYQGEGLELDRERILHLARWITGDCAPERVLLLRLSAERAAARREQAAGPADRIESRNRDYFERVVAAYDQLAAAEPERFRVLDAGTDEDALAVKVREAIDELL